jgi:hypothetical protein
MSRDSVSSFFSEAIVFVEALFFDLPLAFEALAFPRRSSVAPVMVLFGAA